MDLGLPDGDAVDVIRRIKTEHEGTIVVAFSGWHHLERAARAAGVDDFVLKPDVETLQRLLAHHRRPAAASRAGMPRKTA
jgi:CheY-like chemotaxis protein